jgi:hypothetical protein
VCVFVFLTEALTPKVPFKERPYAEMSPAWTKLRAFELEEYSRVVYALAILLLSEEVPLHLHVRAC